MYEIKKLNDQIFRATLDLYIEMYKDLISLPIQDYTAKFLSEACADTADCLVLVRDDIPVGLLTGVYTHGDFAIISMFIEKQYRFKAKYFIDEGIKYLRALGVNHLQAEAMSGKGNALLSHLGFIPTIVHYKKDL